MGEVWRSQEVLVVKLRIMISLTDLLDKVFAKENYSCILFMFP